MNWFVKYGTISKVWLTKISEPPLKVILNIPGGRNRTKFQESLHWRNGKHLQSLWVGAL